MRSIQLLITFIGFLTIFCTCKPDSEMEPDLMPLPSCEGTFFGQPVEATNLDDDVCKPTCACLDFTSRNFTPAQLESLLSWQLSTPFSSLIKDPYLEETTESNEMVCAMVIEDMAQKLYTLANYSNAAAAEAASAILTHHDACRLCSTLTDFVVYAKDRDIGVAVRNCGLANFFQPIDSLVVCLESLGFTKPCAQIWAFNTQHTQNNCLDECINSEIYHNSDGSLSECLACDEQKSLAVFKAVAGRTRRNTGLASSICRPCENQVLKVLLWKL